MKAIVCRGYGPPRVLRLEEVDQPVPGDAEVLIRVRAAAVNPLDKVFRGTPYVLRPLFGLRGPKDTRPGRDMAGQVEAVGKSVTRFKPGDDVFGVCRGAFAEYACAAESRLAPKPAGVSFEQAAAAPVAGLTALQGLRDRGQVRPGHAVLINGAAGGVGTFAVQIAKSLGAEVTGVCGARNVDLVGSLGADRVIDYTREDFTTGTERYDLIFDCVGNRPLFALRRLLEPQGRYLAVGAAAQGRWIGPLGRVLKTLIFSRVVSRRFQLFLAKVRTEDLVELAELMAGGKVRPVIDRRYALAQVPEALHYLEEGHARGKVVITI
jgi:NADPH:quinone reductase-like Zn-dependent oxidoreductase